MEYALHHSLSVRGTDFFSSLAIYHSSKGVPQCRPPLTPKSFEITHQISVAPFSLSESSQSDFEAF